MPTARRELLLFLGFLALAGNPAGKASACVGNTEMTSPDGKTTVRINREGAKGCGESRIEVFEADGHLLAIADYTSRDGKNGEGVEFAVWSADSRFFVFSTSNSEGRHKGSFLIEAYGREANRLQPVAEAAKAEFSLGEGDMVDFAGKDGGTRQVELATK